MQTIRKQAVNALFGVYLDVNDNKVFDEGIDTFVDHMQEIEPGVYRMDGLRYNGYFLFESKKLEEGFLKDDRYFYFQISADGETVMVENEKKVSALSMTCASHSRQSLSPTDRRPFAYPALAPACFRLACIHNYSLLQAERNINLFNVLGRQTSISMSAAFPLYASRGIFLKSSILKVREKTCRIKTCYINSSV